MSYSPWGRKESDTTEQLSLSLSYFQHQQRIVPPKAKLTVRLLQLGCSPSLTNDPSHSN